MPSAAILQGFHAPQRLLVLTAGVTGPDSLALFG
jgi:hypothetical protein